MSKAKKNVYTINKLIEEAKKLYNEIDELQHKSALSDDETLIKVKCFMSNIIKHNIVDEVWKDSNHIPSEDKKVIVINNKGAAFSGYLFIDEYTFTVKIDSFSTITSDKSNLYRWAYVDDLLPKGGK